MRRHNAGKLLLSNLVAAFVLSACGSFKSDLEKMCNVETLSAVPLGEPGAMQAARREWLAGQLSSSKGKELFEVLGTTNPVDWAGILTEQAKSQGLAECPHAEMMAHSIFESSSMQLPVSASPTPLEEGASVMLGGGAIYVDGVAVAQLENGLVPAGLRQTGAGGSYIKPLHERMLEIQQKAQAMARMTGAAGASVGAVLAADHRLSARLIMEAANALKEAGVVSVQLAVAVKDSPWRYAALPTRMVAETPGPTLTLSSQGFILSHEGGSPVQIPKTGDAFNWGALAASLRQTWTTPQNQLRVTIDGDITYGEMVSALNASRLDGAGWLYPNAVLVP